MMKTYPEAASTLVTMVINLLQEVGIHINPQKSEAIVLDNDILTQTSIKTIYGDIQSISADERVKYLGVSFNQKLIFNSTEIFSKLQSNLDTLATTHLLQSQQKLNIINQFIGPTLIYPFQTAQIDLIPKSFLVKADNIIRSCVKEVLQLPADTPNSMIYTSSKYKESLLFVPHGRPFRSS